MSFEAVTPRKAETPDAAQESQLHKENPELFKYFADRIRQTLSEKIARSGNQLPETERSYTLMANYLATEAEKLGVSLDSEEAVNNLVGNPMFHIGIAYAAMARRHMEGGRAGA
jgi:hypothetical protein